MTADAEPADRTLGRVVWPPLRSLSRINWYDSSVVGQGFPFVVDGDASSRAELPHLADGAGLALLARRARAARASRRATSCGSYRARRAPQADARPALSPLERALASSSGRAAGPPWTSGARRSRRSRTSSTPEDDETGEPRASAGLVASVAGTEEMTELVDAIREDHAPPA